MIQTNSFSRIFESASRIPELGEIVSASSQWQEVSVRIGYRNTVGSVVHSVVQQGATLLVTSETPLFELSVFVNSARTHASASARLAPRCLTSYRLASHPAVAGLPQGPWLYEYDVCTRHSWGERVSEPLKSDRAPQWLISVPISKTGFIWE